MNNWRLSVFMTIFKSKNELNEEIVAFFHAESKISLIFPSFILTFIQI